MFETVFPMLTSADLDAAVAFYHGLLGCEITYRFPPTGAAQYVEPTLGGAALCVYTTSCDDAVELLRANGVVIAEEPVDQPWGERMAVVVDPDGNRVVLMQRADR